MTFALAALVLGAVSLRAEPASLVLEKGGTARVEIQVTGENGQPVPDAKVAMSSNAGTFSAVDALGGGRFQARYQPPAERYPNIALVLATVDAGGKRQWGWLSLPLLARATLQIDTKPRAQVTATLAARSFGPAPADARGHLSLPAVVPPGLAEAAITATDKAGNVTHKPLDLKQVPLLRTRLTASAGVASWADAEPLAVEVFAVQPDGTPLTTQDKLQLNAKRGQLEPLTLRTPGVFASRYHAPEWVGDGKDVLTVTLEGTASAVLELATHPGQAAALAVKLEPAQYVAGAQAPVRVGVQTVDARGNVVGPAQASLSSDVGTLDGAVLHVPDNFGGHTQAVIHAQGSGLSGEATLPLQAGPPARGDLTVPPVRLRAGDALRDELAVTDAFGNAVEHATLEAVTTGGAAAQVEEQGGGRYIILYATAVTDADQPLGLTVRSGETTLAVAEPVVLWPYQRPWGLGAGLWFALDSNLAGSDVGGAKTSASPRLELSLRLGQSDAEVVVHLAALLYAQKVYEDASMATQLSCACSGTFVKLTNPGVTAEAGLRYSFLLTPRVSAEVTGMLGVVAAKALLGFDERVTGGTVSMTTLSLRGGGGLTYAVGPGRAVAEVSYGWADASLFPGPVSGNLLGLGVAVGYLVSF
jgi:hypothetical protein